MRYSYWRRANMKQYPITRATRNGEAQPFRFTPPDPRRHDATLAAAKGNSRASARAPGAAPGAPARFAHPTSGRADWHRREAPPARPLTGPGTMPGTHPDPPGAPPVGDGVPVRFGFVARYKEKLSCLLSHRTVPNEAGCFVSI